MTTHTPEPWYIVPTLRVDPGVLRRWEFPIYRQDGHFGHPATGTNEADAKRIVACVNACAGLSPAFLESGGIGRLYTCVVAARDALSEILPVAQEFIEDASADIQEGGDGAGMGKWCRAIMAHDALVRILSEIPAPADAEKADG